MTLLEPGEILLEFVVPKLPPNTGAAYSKHTRRAAMELPLLGVAVLLSLGDDGITCTEARIGLGVLAPTPMRARRAEAILRGKKVSDELLKKAEVLKNARRGTVSGGGLPQRNVEVLVP
jgi:carbon-monoxide dehydrogenase medium subunit